jgi:4-diphosphocytidyl-2-C-methyl-D-erythritol kinase
MSLSELARAKINLSLKVLGRRSDGYHELESVVVFADCGDRVRLSPGSGCRVRVTGPFARDILGPNLLDRTVAVLRDLDPGLRFGSIELEKALPVAAGLGGGSADAAALLRSVRRANPQRADRIPWRQVALQLGADVPMCFDGVPAFVSGIGEKAAPLRGFPMLQAVLANPRLPLATSRVFAALGQLPPPFKPRAPALPPTLPDLAGVTAFMRAHANALEDAATALLPIIAEVKSAIAALPGCRIAAMSGSGPTCFGIFASKAAALAGADLLAAQRPGYWVVAAELAGS